VYAKGVDDGAIEAGAALSYTDNGDGTITDNNTKLMWEKKDDANPITGAPSSGSASDLHNVFNLYSWSGLCQDNSTPCGTNADCTGVSGTALCSATDGQGTGYTIFQWVAQLNSGTGFASHTDWRIPNVKELQSIVDYGTVNPAVVAYFNTSYFPGCLSGCTLDGAGNTTECSCTQPSYYLSATTFDVSNVWCVTFDYGTVVPISGLLVGSPKTTALYVRAVRGGL
jgi:hypothetical protein